MCFVEEQYLRNVLALYNTKIMQSFLQVVSPTLDYHEGPVGKTPILLDDNAVVDEKSQECIDISKKDWDASETSWDFKRSPLV